MLSVQYPEIKYLFVHLCVHTAPRDVDTRAASPKITLSFLHKSASFRAPRVRRRDTGCERNEDLARCFATDGLFSSRSRNPSFQKGARLLSTRSSTQNALKRPIQLGVVPRLALAVARHRVRAKRRFWNIFCHGCALLVEISRSVAARGRTTSAQKSWRKLGAEPGRRGSEHPTSLISGK